MIILVVFIRDQSRESTLNDAVPWQLDAASVPPAKLFIGKLTINSSLIKMTYCDDFRRSFLRGISILMSTMNKCLLCNVEMHSESSSREKNLRSNGQGQVYCNSRASYLNLGFSERCICCVISNVEYARVDEFIADGLKKLGFCGLSVCIKFSLGIMNVTSRAWVSRPLQWNVECFTSLHLYHVLVVEVLLGNPPYLQPICIKQLDSLLTENFYAHCVIKHMTTNARKQARKILFLNHQSVAIATSHTQKLI